MKQPKYQTTLAGGFGAEKREHGTAEIVINSSGHGYLWLGNGRGGCIAWIDQRQMDAIARQWQKLRGRAAEKEQR